MGRILGAVLAAVLWAAVGAAQAPPPFPPGFPQPPRDNRTAAPATAIIRGHVFDAASGQPLRKAQVRAFSPELRENRLVVTDNNGAYEIKELAAGRYSLTASKGSFVNLQYGQTRPFEPGKPLELQDAQLLDKVDFRLPRGGVITGRVIDEAGEPTSDVQVTAMRYTYFNGRRQLTNAGRPASTNDVGEFRLFALPPGQYYISANLRALNLNPLDSASSDRSGYAPTYFPGTPNVNEAQRVTINVGQTVADINIALTPTKLARISGVVVDSNGRPLVNAFVTMIQINGPGLMSMGGVSQVHPDGSFAINGVSPGDYVLRANGPAAPGSPPEIAQANVTVAGDDINDVTVTVIKMSTVTGRVIPPAQATNFSFTGLQLVASSPTLLVGGGTARVNDDGTFALQVQPGLAFVRMNAVGAFSSVRIRSVRVDGVETVDSGVEFKPNQNVDGVEIELTNQLSSVSGVVTDARGNVVKDYTVVTFARDRERWGSASRYLNTGRPDQDGKYKLLNLPPGDYYAIALDYVEQGSNTDPEFLDRMKERATAFSITEAETKNLDLKLVTGM